MIGADVCSTNHERPAGVADSLQRRDDRVSAPSSEISAVLKSEPTRADFSDDPDGFEEQAGPFAFDAFAFGVCAADVLAWRASDNDVGEETEVGNKSGCRESADVVIDRNPGIVLAVEDATPFDVFAGGDGAIAGAVHAEGPAARRRAE
ncbi:MAG: hypothetical protein ABS87_01075 [Sphingomonas sp. SCN 67-18]|nr:hypothetical protein [Sphingomonas sp. SCN 67-18]ODU22791.1 MAG: hypothetical protein ABS87_01075 [Sphingomonas sp. SCN 67-18]